MKVTIVGLLVLLFLLVFAAACETSGYVGGLSGCRDFNRLLPDIRLGVLTDDELRQEIN